VEEVWTPQSVPASQEGSAARAVDLRKRMTHDDTPGFRAAARAFRRTPGRALGVPCAAGGARIRRRRTKTRRCERPRSRRVRGAVLSGMQRAARTTGCAGCCLHCRREGRGARKVTAACRSSAMRARTGAPSSASGHVALRGAIARGSRTDHAGAGMRTTWRRRERVSLPVDQLEAAPLMAATSRRRSGRSRSHRVPISAARTGATIAGPAGRPRAARHRLRAAREASQQRRRQWRPARRPGRGLPCVISTISSARLDDPACGAGVPRAGPGA